MKTIQQPKIEKGMTFTGWATFNWGICHQRVFRTRKEAIEDLLSRDKPGLIWDDVKDYFRVEKVQCTVI